MNKLYNIAFLLLFTLSLVACVEVAPLDPVGTDSNQKTLRGGSSNSGDDNSDDDDEEGITDDGESGDEGVTNKETGITDNGDESEDEENGAVTKGK
jgi:hypothetical protein